MCIRDRNNITISKLNDKDLLKFKNVIRLFEEVFEMRDLSLPEDAYLKKLLSRKNFIVLAAFEDNTVIGGLTAYVLEQYYSDKPLVYVFDLAVSEKYQRKGVGTRLIKNINEYSKEMGYEEVFVQADRVDDYAVDFYRSTKPTEEEDVVHFYYSLN
jgi:aminoglycoside 3-N-acetyltransferase I